MIKRGGILILLFLLLGALVSADGDIVKGDGNLVDYTKILYNARYYGMGGTGVSFADDSGALLINPASLPRMKHWELSTTQFKIADEFTYTFVNYVLPKENGGFGLSYMYENPGDIFATSGVDAYGHPVIGNKLDCNSQLIAFSYGTNIFYENLRLGGTMKNYRKKLGEVEGKGNSFDLALQYDYSRDVALGLNIKNIFQTGFTYSNTTKLIETFKPTYLLGANWYVLDHTLLLSLDYSGESISKTNFGFEYRFGKNVAVRGGLMDGQMTLGTGFRWDSMQMDMGYKYNEFPLDNQVYITFTYGNAREKVLTTPKISIIKQKREAIE